MLAVEKEGQQGWLRPWMVAVAIAIFAIAGATFVYVAGTAAQRRDQADILAYQTQTAPLMASLDGALSDLTALEPDLATASMERRRTIAKAHRKPLEAARTKLIDMHVPDILRHITADQLNSINRTIGTITQLDRIVAGADPRGDAAREYSERLAVAKLHRESAREKMIELRCLAAIECL
jgi:hypothetical protein